MLGFFEQLLANFQIFIESNPWFAPMAAFLLPFLEALFPWLPLTVLVSFNLSLMAGIYGSVGTFYTIVLSILGSFFGMFLIFLFIRATLTKSFVHKVEGNEFGRKFVTIVEGKNTGLALLLLSNPFLPSAIMNYALSLTKIKTWHYIFITFVSRIFTIVFLVFLGSVFDLQNHPWNFVWLSLVYIVLIGGLAVRNYLKAKKKPVKPLE